MPSASWGKVSLLFKQNYEGGFRFLDHCGEFMYRAQEEDSFIPREEAKPTGCVMDLPEESIELVANTAEFHLRQEGDTDTTKIQELCSIMAGRVQELFQPSVVSRNGLAVQLVKIFGSEEEAFKAMLGVWGNYEGSLGTAVGMAPQYKSLDYTLTSGSYRLNVKIAPATIRAPSNTLQVPLLHDSAAKRANQKRKNDPGKRVKLEAGYGLLCQIDLMEELPPPDSLAKHFKELQRIQAETVKLLP